MVEHPVHTRYVPGSSPGAATTPRAAASAAVARIRRRVATAIDRRGLLAPGERVVVACSGGPDSTVLLDVLARLAPARSLHLTAVHVDHGLRPGSAADAVHVAALAASLGMPFVAVTVAVEPGGSLQNAARRARHAALRETAERLGATAIALGHTADDQAETVLHRALTGSTPRSLAAMRARHDGLVRPLLRTWRADVEAYLEARGLDALRDPANADRRFTRSRVRHDLLPAIEAVYPGARRRLVVLADLQQAVLDGTVTPPPPPRRARRR